MDDALIAEAFAFADASGAELLVKLGKYHVWYGDLGEMRGDSPPTTRATPEPPTSSFYKPSAAGRRRPAAETAALRFSPVAPGSASARSAP